MNEYMEDRKEHGFTLIELLVAIVVVGILTAVAIVGIAGLTDKGTKSACAATLDAVKAAQAVHFANNSGSTTPYPTSFTDLTSANELEQSGSTTITASTITGSGGWHLDTVVANNDGTAPMVITKTNC
jgi:prepilin-type N-terminal cleavage/methylation domain-containing protein